VVVQRRKRKYYAIIVFHNLSMEIIKVLFRNFTKIKAGNSKSPNFPKNIFLKP